MLEMRSVDLGHFPSVLPTKGAATFRRLKSSSGFVGLEHGTSTTSQKAMEVVRQLADAN